MSYRLSKRIREEIESRAETDSVQKLALEILIFEIENWRKDIDFRAKYERIIDNEIEEAEQ